MSVARLMCPENSIWPETPSNTTAMYACPLGESGFITRFCTLEGVWLAANTSACRMMSSQRLIYRTDLLSK